MIWRTWGSLSHSSARSAYSTRVVGFVAPAETRRRYCGVSASSRSSRRPRASLVAVPREGIRSPRISREIVEWSTPDCCASWRWDIFLALSWARSHSLNARPFWEVIVESGTPGGEKPPNSGGTWTIPHLGGPLASPVGTVEVSAAYRSRGRFGGVRSRPDPGPSAPSPCGVRAAHAGSVVMRWRLPDLLVARCPKSCLGRPEILSGCHGAGRPAGPLAASAAQPASAPQRRQDVGDRAQDDDREHADRPVDEDDRPGFGASRSRRPRSAGPQARLPRRPGPPA